MLPGEIRLSVAYSFSLQTAFKRIIRNDEKCAFNIYIFPRGGVSITIQGQVKLELV